MQADLKQFCTQHFEAVKPLLHGDDSTEDIHPKAMRECAGIELDIKVCPNQTFRTVRFENTTLNDRIKAAQAAKLIEPAEVPPIVTSPSVDVVVFDASKSEVEAVPAGKNSGLNVPKASPVPGLEA